MYSLTAVASKSVLVTGFRRHIPTALERDILILIILNYTSASTEGTDWSELSSVGVVKMWDLHWWGWWSSKDLLKHKEQRLQWRHSMVHLGAAFCVTPTPSKNCVSRTFTLSIIIGSWNETAEVANWLEECMIQFCLLMYTGTTCITVVASNRGSDSPSLQAGPPTLPLEHIPWQRAHIPLALQNKRNIPAWLSCSQSPQLPPYTSWKQIPTHSADLHLTSICESWWVNEGIPCCQVQSVTVAVSNGGNPSLFDYFPIIFSLEVVIRLFEPNEESRESCFLGAINGLWNIATGALP